MEASKASGTSGQPFVIERTLDAPRDVVWKAWTEAERLAQWWGPKGLAMIHCSVDLKPGGLFHYGMRTPDGHEMWGKFVYREVVAPERLVYVVSFSDKDGGITRHPMSATWPLEMLNTLTLSEEGAKTFMRLEGTAINATDEERQTFESCFESMEQGFKGTMEQLEAYLAHV